MWYFLERQKEVFVQSCHNEFCTQQKIGKQEQLYINHYCAAYSSPSSSNSPKHEFNTAAFFCKHLFFLAIPQAPFYFLETVTTMCSVSDTPATLCTFNSTCWCSKGFNADVTPYLGRCVAVNIVPGGVWKQILEGKFDDWTLNRILLHCIAVDVWVIFQKNKWEWNKKSSWWAYRYQERIRQVEMLSMKESSPWLTIIHGCSATDSEWSWHLEPFCSWSLSSQ